MLRYYKQKQCFIKLFCKYSCCGTISKSTISSIFFVNIHICLLSVSKSLQQRYIFSCLWHCQQLPVCFKMSQSVPICLKMSQNQLNFSQNSFWDILRHFEQFWADFWGRYETFWDILSWFWAILSGFLGQVWDILRHFELILSNFEQFWAILSGICSASNLYIWIVLSIYMSFLHNWNSQIMEIEARS